MVRMGRGPLVENDLPRCTSCGKHVRFGFLFSLGPAAFQGEGLVKVQIGGRHWRSWVYCRGCEKRAPR